MGRMLNLLGTLVSKARHMQELGRSHDALPILRRLGTQPNLPATQAADMQQLLGELYLDTRQFRLARKHLARAMRLQPEDALNFHLMARAIECDPEVDALRASRYYRHALELAPNDPRLVADYGLFAVQMGRITKGLAHLRSAVALAPDNLEVLRTLIDALCELRRFEEAQCELQRARFRHGRNPRFQKVVHDLEFRQLRHEQRQTTAVDAGERAVLPFVRLHATDGVKGRKRYIRHDAGSRPRPHFPRVLRPTDSSRVP